MDAFGAQAEGLELGDLVLHQRDERRHDERDPAADEAGELVTERLSCAGAHDEKDVLAFGHRPAYCFLPGPEGFQAEGGTQDLAEPLRKWSGGDTAVAIRETRGPGRGGGRRSYGRPGRAG